MGEARAKFVVPYIGDEPPVIAPRQDDYPLAIGEPVYVIRSPYIPIPTVIKKAEFEKTPHFFLRKDGHFWVNIIKPTFPGFKFPGVTINKSTVGAIGMPKPTGPKPAGRGKPKKCRKCGLYKL